MLMARSAVMTATNGNERLEKWQTGQPYPTAQLSLVSRSDRLTGWRCVITLWRLLRGRGGRRGLPLPRCKLETMSAIGCWQGLPELLLGLLGRMRMLAGRRMQDTPREMLLVLAALLLDQTCDTLGLANCRPPVLQALGGVWVKWVHPSYLMGAADQLPLTGQQSSSASLEDINHANPSTQSSTQCGRHH
jgi:hypothetical protein